MKPVDDNIPPLGNWQTASKRVTEKRGDPRIYKREFKKLAQLLTDAIADQVTGGDKAEAAALVEANLVGIRRIPGKYELQLAISPDAQRILDEQEESLALGDWETCSMHEQKKGVDNRVYARRLQRLAEILTDNIANFLTDGDRTAATQLVKTNFIGLRYPKSGSDVTLAASPTVWHFIDKYGAQLTRRGATPSQDERSSQFASKPELLKSGWETANMHAKRCGGNHVHHHDRLAALAERLLDETTVKETNGDRTAAAQLVNERWIGMRQGKKSAASLAGSPEAWEMADKGWARREKKDKEAVVPPMNR